MKSLLKNDLRQLLNHDSVPCVSLYLPTHRAGPEILQDPIRLKNLLRKAESELELYGSPHSEISQVLRPARELLDDWDFWQHQGDGLAILSSPNLFRTYRVQLTVPELAVVSDRFHLKPLIGWIESKWHYYIMALSQKGVRVFRATRENISELDPTSLPDELKRTLKDELPERQVQPHSVAVSGGGGRGFLFHDHGGGDEDRKEALLTYFRRVDAGMRHLLAGEPAPVILACVDFVNAIFRQANSNPELLSEWISGNADDLTKSELHEKANAIAAAHFARDQAKAVDQYLRLWATGRSSNILAEILPAAYQGRVELLFVARGVHQWGRFDESMNEIEIDEEQMSRDQDLLNLAAIQTYVTGGTVYAVTPDQVPGQGKVAAVFRY